MKFGCIGVREIWWGSKKVISEWKKKGSKGGQETKEPENMFGQLEFRDMYACAEAASKNFQQIRGNAACRSVRYSILVKFKLT
jgi:cryptochrome